MPRLILLLRLSRDSAVVLLVWDEPLAFRLTTCHTPIVPSAGIQCG
ncbi:MAG: hypothetical protein OJF49_003733 [Ktedonobacterales bacterium]|nr:MAG: hypothetical protein OJF49_003733 [Ktedonobacterales bacterium]